MSKRTLTVTDPVFSEFNRLKIRVASDSGNRIPAVNALVSALISIGELHYEELTAALAKVADDATD